MTDDNRGDMTPQPTPPTQPQGGVAAPPPPPPAPPATGEYGRWDDRDRPKRRGGILGGVILVVIGLILLAQQFLPQIAFEKLWPVILIVIGISIIFRRR